MRQVAAALAALLLAAGPCAWEQKFEELAMRLVRVPDAND
jgi:hypothetical protein